MSKVIRVSHYVVNSESKDGPYRQIRCTRQEECLVPARFNCLGPDSDGLVVEYPSRLHYPLNRTEL